MTPTNPNIANLQGHFESKCLSNFVKVFDELFEEKSYDGKGVQHLAFGISREQAARWNVYFSKVTRQEALACWYLHVWLPMMGQEIACRSLTLAKVMLLVSQVSSNYEPKQVLSYLARSLNSLQSPECAYFPLQENGNFNPDIIRCLDSYLTWRKSSGAKALAASVLTQFTFHQLDTTRKGGYCEEAMYQWLLRLKCLLDN